MKKLLLILLLGFAAPSYATTWYVSATGSNSNNCTAAQTITTPKLTIAAALACVGAVGTEDGAGDTVEVAAGNYSGSANGELLNIIPSGSSEGARFTLKCVTDLACHITAVYPAFMFRFDGTAHYITIRGFAWTGGQGGVFSSNTPNTTHHVNIVNNSFSSAPDSMFIQGSGSNDILISGNLIHDVADCRNLSFEGLCHGIYASTNTNRWIIENNQIYNTHGYCIQLNDSSGTALPTDFIIRNNDLHHCGVPALTGSAITIQGSGHQIYNNTMWANAYSGIWLKSDSTTVYFNTIYGNLTDGGIRLFGVSGANCRNNIIYGNGGSAFVNGTCNTASNNLTTDPSFQNAAIGEFHLTTGSAALPPCGVAIGGITTDKDGVTRPNPPSCGAFEVPSGSDPADPLAENFDAYTATSSIDTLNGGAGWTTAWQLTDGTVTVETAPAWMSGKSLRQNAAATAEAKRFFTAHSGAFSIFFNMSLSTTPNDYIVVSALSPSGATLCRVAFDSAGDLYVESAVLDSVITTNHSYAVEMNFDTDGQANKCRAKVDGGSYSAWQTAAAAFVSVGGLKLNSYATNAHTFWLDNISDEVGVGGSGTITNVTPNTGQVCVSGSTCAISWGSNGITGAVNVYYLVGGNQYLIASPDVTATPYAWTVNAPAGTTIKTRVSQSSVSSDSGEFTVRGTKAYFK